MFFNQNLCERGFFYDKRGQRADGSWAIGGVTCNMLYEYFVEITFIESGFVNTRICEYLFYKDTRKN